MNKDDITKIINAATKECQKNFNLNAVKDYTIASKTVIPFTTETLHSRKISDWGTDEDEDKYLWYSANGWELCWQTTQVGAGVQKVVSEKCTSLLPNAVIEVYEQLDTLHQLEFLHKCYKVLAISEFRYEIK